MPQHVSEESFKLKRSFLFASLAAVAAIVMPLAAAGQVASESGPATRSTPSFKYEVYAGFAYTSLNQVTRSRYGLMGGQLSVTRNWGRYSGLRSSVDYYRPPLNNSSYGNPGDPSVYSVLAGPELHMEKILGNVGGLAFAELGVEHTGGENMSPDTSFAAGFGGGLTYNLSRRLAIEVTGDSVAGSFSPINNTPENAYSGHVSWNPRATIGVVYRF
jgi:hypothetical protein